MNIEAKKRLFDARKACGLIAGFIAGRGFEEYTSDAMLSSAVERQFEIVGEALRLAELADPSATTQIPDLRRIVGLRNRLIHGYDSVDNQVIWDILQNDLPVLSEQLDAILG